MSIWLRPGLVGLGLTWALLACSDGTSGLRPGESPDASTPDAAPNADAEVPDLGSAPDTGPAVPPGEVIDLGPIALTNGDSDVVNLTIPEGVESFMIVVEGPESAWYIVRKLEGPTGVLVSDDDSMLNQIERFLLGPYGAQFKSPNRVTQDWGIAAATFPNNPGVTVTGGAYTLQLGGLIPQGNQGTPFTGEVTAKVYLRKTVVATGKLDVHLYFTGAGGMNATNAETNALVQDTLGELRTIYGQIGVELGAVTYDDIDPMYQTITDLTNAGGDLDEMFALSKGDGGLHYFIVARFMGGFPGAMVAGISGGLPGAPDRVGRVGSGVAVGADVVGPNAATLAHVMAHEAGHWLGLFHTSEITGTEDQHPETPGGQGGNTYLMYPAVGGGTTISPSQGAAVRRHLTVLPQ